MRQIVPNVYTFTGLLAGRVYALEDADGFTLVDASINSAAPKILRQLQAAGHPPERVKRILITHAHPDHIGSLPALKAATGAEVYIHPLERPVAENGAIIQMPPPETLGFPWRAMKMPPTSLPPTPIDHTLNDGDMLPALGGLQAVFTPGHAPGHLSFWSPSRRLLITGDVFFHLPLFGLTPPFPMFTVSMAENARSARRLADLPTEVVLFGHGQPILTGGQTALRASLRKFKTQS